MHELLPFLMFAVLLILLMAGFPVAFTLAGTALIFALLGHALDLFYLSDLGFVPGRIWGITSNFTLVAVPLFVFMGLVLERAGLAEELLTSFSEVFQKQKGSLAIAVVMVGGLLAASTGIVGATVVTMGVLSLPTMLKAGYDKSFASGTIAASGTLGQIIPPSIILVLLGDMMNVDVGDVFVGAVFPGLLLLALYFAYVILHIRLSPVLAPPPLDPVNRGGRLLLISALIPPLLLIVLVLGSILFGIASPSEAAACGALGSMVIAVLKGRFRFADARSVSRQTAKISAMVFMILIGAQFFGIVFRGLSGDEVLVQVVQSLTISPALILFAIMLLIFVLGFFLDFLEICFIIIPVIMPILSGLGFDKLWLAILIALNLQTSFLTPPFGFSLFYLKGVAPPEVKTTDIYRGIVPFLGLQVIAIILICLFPSLVLWLPRQVW